MNAPRDLFSHRKHWAARLGTAPFLPTTRAEMDALGWDACDVIIVTGDAYVDHPSFGMAIVGRLLEAHGFTTVKGQLDQALASHTRGEWASANAQLHTFYEALFDQFAYELLPGGRSLATSENRRAAPSWFMMNGPTFLSGATVGA